MWSSETNTSIESWNFFLLLYLSDFFPLFCLSVRPSLRPSVCSLRLSHPSLFPFPHIFSLNTHKHIFTGFSSSAPLFVLQQWNRGTVEQWNSGIPFANNLPGRLQQKVLPRMSWCTDSFIIPKRGLTPSLATMWRNPVFLILRQSSIQTAECRFAKAPDKAWRAC